MTAGSPPPRLDHVGIAVRRLADSLIAWTEGAGLVASTTEEVPSERVRVAFLPVGGSRIELLEPTDPESAIARFIERHGEGIHHICLEVGSIEAVLSRLDAAGVPLIDRVPRPGAGGSRVAFVHPRGLGGVLLELREKT
jgi:methylmalonyl-CoA epimerase